MSSLSSSSTEILTKPDLNLKECLELFKSEKFSLETFLELRSDCINKMFLTSQQNYHAIITIIRGPFSDFLRQALTIFSTSDDKTKIFRVACHKLFTMVSALRTLAKSVSWTQSELAQMWLSTILASEALKPFCADFSPFLEAILAEKAFILIKSVLDERISTVPSDEIENINVSSIEHNKYNLSTTIVLNAVVDAINQVRLYPQSRILESKLKVEIQQNPIFTKNIKTWAISQLDLQ